MNQNLGLGSAQFEKFKQFFEQQTSSANTHTDTLSSSTRNTEESTEAPDANSQIVISNLPEQSGKSAEQLVKDWQTVEKIFQSLIDRFHISDIRRIGKLELSHYQETPRKLLVQLASKEEQKELLKRAKELKESAKWKGVSMKARKQKMERLRGEEKKDLGKATTSGVEVKEEEQETPTTLLNPFRSFDRAEAPACRKERNILVLGATGVGKSTWINGIGNYIKFESLVDALGEQEPICLIPIEFTLHIGPPTKVSRAADIESEETEVASSAGQSCTQSPKVYRFVTDSVAFNVIDTPGIGDTRGVVYDMENMRMIMKSVAQFDRIHGICLLLKPNESRLVLSLRYCMHELLSNLHRNSIPNLFVVFTNTSETNYKPGDTRTVLKTCFDDVNRLSQTQLSLTNENTFCVDNEAVRMIYAHHNGFEFDEGYTKIFSASWDHTVSETYRLFDCITDLDHHWANESKVCAIVREFFRELCSLAANVNEQMKQKQKALEQQKVKLRCLEGELAEASKMVVFHGEYLEERPITTPNVVCCGPNCIEMVMDPKTNQPKRTYKKVCLESCELENVPPNQTGEASLRNLSIFTSDSICNNCECSWQTHMLILQKQTKKNGEFEIRDEEKEKAKNSLQLQIQAKTVSLKTSEQEVISLKETHEKTQRTARVYLEFLKENSILSTNAAFEEYLLFSIKQLEKTMKTGGDRSEIEKLQQLVRCEQQQKLLEDLDEKIDQHEKITLANYRLKISKLKEASLIGALLSQSEAFEKPYETRPLTPFSRQTSESEPLHQAKKENDSKAKHQTSNFDRDYQSEQSEKRAEKQNDRANDTISSSERQMNQKETRKCTETRNPNESDHLKSGGFVERGESRFSRP